MPTTYNMSRSHARWTNSECVKMLISIKRGQSLSEIAIEHGRTRGAITERLKLIAVDYYDEEFSIKDIRKYTGLTVNQIKTAVITVYTKKHVTAFINAKFCNQIH